ncbi:hypothetical protein, conserved [Trypanosoma brucei brucei TREU927]|uniref:Uncharacterized protein n=1 Tax=Trypanosoma brucei brucei (strain 927/4 GUTat10.1) TaxID=185431 RepID=Q38DB5_TRYB2|nr:hypothetical protein, conserved [Trypanosoma brucei brucei TREU927]EAN77205.1 hypothetical protein, conserved [Trypanosoma brucei brucei TREU927]
MKDPVVSGSPVVDAAVLPCTQLRANRRMPLLWLPMSLCKQLYSEHGEGNATTIGRNGEDNMHGNMSGDSVEQVLECLSGLERGVLNAVLRQPFLPIHTLREAFPVGRNYNFDDDLFEILVRVASNVDSVTASASAEVEVHMGTAAVVVVLNCYEHEPNLALKAVGYVFEKYFKNCACRCVVLDPPADIESGGLREVLIPVSTGASINDVANHVLREVAFAMVRRADARLVELSSMIASIVEAKPGPSDLSSVLRFKSSSKSGKGSATADAAPSYGSGTSLMKRKGDLLLILGSFNAALMSYDEALGGADALWCAATLEAIATLRFMQNAPLLALRESAESTFVSLAFDGSVWSNDMKKTMDEIDKVTSTLQVSQRKALTALKRNTALSVLGKRLTKEVEDPLSSQCESLRRRIRSLDETMSNERVEKYGRRALGCLRQIIHLSFHELHLYLNEALQLLRTVVGARTLLRERELNIHVKRAELLAEEGDKQSMLECFSLIKDLAAQSGDGTLQQRIRTQIPRICARAGCCRKAIHYIADAALTQRRKGANGSAILLLLMACRVAGIPFPENGLGDDITVLTCSRQGQDILSPAVANGDAKSSSTKKECASLRLGTRPCEAQAVPLLTELLDAITEEGFDSDAKCSVASMLLFDYYPFLSDDTQESLMTLIAKKSAHYQSLHCSTPPFLDDMEVLPLPPHLEPKTISLSGAQFTFIDTGRLKMTVLTLNGKIIPQGQVVWSVGTVGEVTVVLKNPLRTQVELSSVALSCCPVSSLNGDGGTTNLEEEHGLTTDAPSTYVVTNVTLQPMSKLQLCLQVLPTTPGFLSVKGVEIRFSNMPWCGTFMMPVRKPEVIPVLQELPMVSCALGVNEVEIFCGQTVEFTLHVVNTGRVPVHKFQITVHDESCQLDTCEGCKERLSASSLYVTIERDPSTEQRSESSLEVGGVTTRRVTIASPLGSDNKAFQHIVFRTCMELPYNQPTAPPGIPSAVPVFAVIPRRVQETYLRVFEAPSLAVTSVSLSRDRRYVELCVRNMNTVHTIELLCSHLSFANIPDALIVAGAEYLVPPIEIIKVPRGTKQIPLPWVVRGQPKCGGTLYVDFSIASAEAVCMEPLEDAIVTIKTLPNDLGGLRNQQLVNVTGGELASIILPVMKPVQLLVCVSAPWKRVVPLRVRLAMEQQALDMSVLSGAVDAVHTVGGGETNDATRLYQEVVEVFAFKMGEHPLSVTLSDADGRETTHTVRLQWKHI